MTVSRSVPQIRTSGGRGSWRLDLVRMGRLGLGYADARNHGERSNEHIDKYPVGSHRGRRGAGAASAAAREVVDGPDA